MDIVTFWLLYKILRLPKYEATTYFQPFTNHKNSKFLTIHKQHSLTRVPTFLDYGLGKAKWKISSFAYPVPYIFIDALSSSISQIHLTQNVGVL